MDDGMFSVDYDFARRRDHERRHQRQRVPARGAGPRMVGDAIAIHLGGSHDAREGVWRLYGGFAVGVGLFEVRRVDGESRVGGAVHCPSAAGGLAGE